MTGDNKQIDEMTFDPPTCLSELTQNLIRSSHGHSTPFLKISCKSVQPFSRNVADKETNKERKKSHENNTPSPTGGGVIKESKNNLVLNQCNSFCQNGVLNSTYAY